MLWILIFSFVIIWWFQAYTSVSIWKVKLMQKVNTEKQNIYFIEKFFEEIKKWWVIDFEEYFNRKVVGTTFSSGHYDKPTWFWNFWNTWIPENPNYWDLFYYCRSNNTDLMSNTGANPSLWCFDKIEFNSGTTIYSWQPQRYWEYSFQFIDYNSNKDADIIIWDEDWDWNIVWDDDDEFLWRWPIAFSGWTDLKELYLIWWNKKSRTIFRWNVKEDPNKPPAENCNTVDWITFTWSWCLWTIEMLKLIWKDWWMDHVELSIDATQSDWVIDTWLIDPDYSWWLTDKVAWSDNDNYWVPIFPDTLNIIDFKVFLYPNIDYSLAWKDNATNIRISPYVKFYISILPSRKSKIWLKWNPKPVNFSTTISLTDIFSK